MFENDAIHSFQRTTPRRTKVSGLTDTSQQIKDDFIMDTNNSSIVSKRSVEKLYWTGEPEYFRHFVSKFKRRSPLINRGYWLRMRAVEHTVEKFLEEPSEKKRLVVNLGCGYDPLPWLFLGKQKRAHLCHNVTFVDVDYPQLMRKKMTMIQGNDHLKKVVPGLTFTTAKDGVLCRSDSYVSVGCDLRNLDFLKFVMASQLGADDCTVAILFVAEVSIAYMDLEGSQAVMQWAASYDDARFCLLEQHLPDGPDHPFAQTMLKHFEKLRTPLRQIGTMDTMRKRFQNAGWPRDGINIRSLWQLWSDESFLAAEQRRALDKIEPFDEWEEFALFSSHYFLLVAVKSDQIPSIGANTTVQEGNATLGPSIRCDALPQVSIQRRFAAIVSPSSDKGQIGVNGGLGTKERLASTDIISVDESQPMLNGPTLLAGIMCHSITRLHDSNDCLMVGGRMSPERAIADCWLRENDCWKSAQSLPFGRYRHSAIAVQHEGTPAVLIFGGKSSAGQHLSDFLFWRRDTGWRQLEVHGDVMLPSCGATMIVDDGTESSGRIFGGLSNTGVIHEQAWSWSLDGHSIQIRNITTAFTLQLSHSSSLAWRFGAQAAQWEVDGTLQTLLIGGITSRTMLTAQTEILNVTKACVHPINGFRPMLVGHSMYARLCLGGGATCFSFGTYWSDAIAFRFSTEPESARNWHSVSSKINQSKQKQDVADYSSNTTSMERTTARELTDASMVDKMLEERKPVILKQCDLGPCVSKWSPDFLRRALGSRDVVVHASSGRSMDFQTKNFKYETLDFSTFLDAAERGENVYMRALSRDAPSERATELASDFPEIAADFALPAHLRRIADCAHSSPLRISGSAAMWLHYDVMSNVLCQVRGRKRLLLFPPSDVLRLGFEAGASSSSLNVFEAGAAHLQQCHPHEALLEPGDILYIPALWLHAAEPTDGYSVAVNIFFKDLTSGYAAGKDVYGNRDLTAYERGRKEVSKVRQAFAGLPAEVSRFYLERLAAELQNGA